MRRHPIEAPPLQPARYGLVAAAAAIANADERWELGVEFAPEGCGGGGVVELDCLPDSGELGDPDDNPGLVGFDAFEVWAADRCTMLAPGRDFAGRARRLLEATRSHQVAAELWGGALTTARHAADGPDDDGPSPFLTDGEATSAGSALGMLAVVRVDAEFARCSAGRRAMIHLTPYALGVVMDGGSGYIYRDGNLLLTQLGSIVVADSGYGDSVTDLEVHATSLVGLRFGPVRTTPAGDTPAEWQAILDRTDNTVTAYAQQAALYQFDADCCRVAGTITTS